MRYSSVPSQTSRITLRVRTQVQRSLGGPQSVLQSCLYHIPGYSTCGLVSAVQSASDMSQNMTSASSIVKHTVAATTHKCMKAGKSFVRSNSSHSQWRKSQRECPVSPVPNPGLLCFLCQFTLKQSNSKIPLHKRTQRKLAFLLFSAGAGKHKQYFQKQFASGLEISFQIIWAKKYD